MNMLFTIFDREKSEKFKQCFANRMIEQSINWNSVLLKIRNESAKILNQVVGLLTFFTNLGVCHQGQSIDQGNTVGLADHFGQMFQQNLMSVIFLLHIGRKNSSLREACT